VVLGIWGEIFHETILGYLASILGKDRPYGRQPALNNPQSTQTYEGRGADLPQNLVILSGPPFSSRSTSCSYLVLARGTGCPPTLSSPKMQGFGKVFHR
jgi:hypothetical protein